VLEGLCVAYARAVAADEMLRNDGLEVEEPILNAKREQTGIKIKTHPAVFISNNAWKQVRAFCSEFGFSPMSRTRLAIERQQSADDDMREILSRPRELKNKCAMRLPRRIREAARARWAKWRKTKQK
jgi:P27 family predicted phage terminase small subunit